MNPAEEINRFIEKALEHDRSPEEVERGYDYVRQLPQSRKKRTAQFGKAELLIMRTFFLTMLFVLA